MMNVEGQLILETPLQEYADYQYEWKLEKAIKLSKNDYIYPCTLHWELIFEYYLNKETTDNLGWRCEKLLTYLEKKERLGVQVNIKEAKIWDEVLSYTKDQTKEIVP